MNIACPECRSVFRVDPDAGSGALEWLVAGTCCAGAAASAVAASLRLRCALRRA